MTWNGRGRVSQTGVPGELYNLTTEGDWEISLAPLKFSFLLMSVAPSKTDIHAPAETEKVDSLVRLSSCYTKMLASLIPGQGASRSHFSLTLMCVCLSLPLSKNQ